MADLKGALLALFLIVTFGTFSNAATLTVTNTNDSGAGSLRQAISDAMPADTIQFAENLAGGTINLQSEIAFGKGLSIIGPASGKTTIDGGGFTRIFNIDGGNNETLIITGLRFANGFGDQDSGGAIRINGPGLELNHCIFEFNTTFCNTFDCDASGAAIENRDGGLDIVINYTTFANNSTECIGDECDASGAAFANGGGGVRFFINKSAFVSNSGTCSGIECDASGAGLNNGGGGVTFEIRNTTFALNSTDCNGLECDADGGGIDNGGGEVTAEINNSTFDLNSTSCTGEDCDQNGASISDLEDVTLSNTIFNTLSATGNCDDFEQITSLGYNIDNGSTCIDGSAPGDKPNTNPFLDTQGPRDNGGPTPTVALLEGSPAIDMASPNCPPPNTDQRGFTRPQGPRCDIGAFEGSITRTNVPTLSEWGLIAMAGVLGIVGFMVMRRRTTSAGI